LDILEFTLFIGGGSFLAGLLGSLTGLGGGVIVVPMLTLLFGVDIHYAIGASLISVIATSSGAAAAYVREGFSNIRIGMFLEIATTIGALFGAFLVALIATGAIEIIFGVVLVISAYLSIRPRKEIVYGDHEDHLAALLKFKGSYPGRDGMKEYNARHVPGGFGLMFVAGTLSGLLGIGSGAFKVLAMDQVMRLPFKVSTTTSNFMIGVTAAASVGIYFGRGYVDPGLAMPVMLGVSAGSLIGARLLTHARTKSIRWIFAFVILATAIEMIIHGLTGKI
jgi:uncharacterized membrane protein YfcA